MALIYEARSIGTKDALKLSSQIQEMAYGTMARFPGFSNRTHGSSQGDENKADKSEDVSDEKLEAALGIARILQRILSEMGIYKDKPGILLRPHALGYLWGWSDAATQKLGIPPNSGESLGVCSGMFMSFFENRLFVSSGEEGFDPEVFAHANKLRDGGDVSFHEGMRLGGSDLFSFIKVGDFPKTMAGNMADIFSDDYFAAFSKG